MSAKVLFACSKCFSRHPYEELSSGQQLCKVNIKMRNSENRDKHTKCNKQKHFNLSYVCVYMHCAKSKGCVRGCLFFW